MVNLSFPPRAARLTRSSLVVPAPGTGVAASTTVTLPPWGAAWRFGIYDSASAHTTNVVTAGVDTVTPLMAALRSNNLDAVYWAGHSLWFHELGTSGGQHRFQTTIAASSFPGVAQVIEETGKWTLNDPPDSIANGWFGDLTHPFDDATAAALLPTIIAYWANRTIDGLGLRDDAQHTGSAATVLGQTSIKAQPLVRVLQAANSGIYVSATPASGANANGIGAIQDMLDAGARAIHFYLYQFGSMQAAGTYGPTGPYAWTNEGNMHSSRFSVSSSHDWSDEYRLVTANVPEDVPVRLICQAHCTGNDGAGGQLATPTSSTMLRYPTAREIREMTWVAIGEGVKSIYWFTWTGVTGWFGLGHASRADVLAVVSELGARLGAGIRARLTRAKRDVTAPFTATGGGNGGNGYTDGYVSTLIDRYDGTRYVVLCNRALSTQNMVVASGTLSGSLSSLETGQRYALGASIALNALDGTILRFIPA